MRARLVAFAPLFGLVLGAGPPAPGAGTAPSGEMHVWDIASRVEGRRLVVTVAIQHDADRDGVAEFYDDPVADASVALTVRHDGDGDGAFDCDRDDCRRFTGTTGTGGEVEFGWAAAPSGAYEAEVTDLTHVDFTWISSFDADNPARFTLARR